VKKLILVLGNLASGKSTLARELSLRLNAPVFVKDEIKEALSDEIGFSNREENKKLSRGTFRVMEYAFMHLLSLDSIILESNFRKYEIERLNSIAQEYNVTVLYLVLSASPDVLYERYVERNPYRHETHHSVDFTTKQQFLDIISDFSDFPFVGRVLHIDTTYGYLLDDIIAWIKQ